MSNTSEKRITKAFKISVIIKSIQGILELAAGIILWFVSNASLIRLIKKYTREELIENPHDFISQSLLQIGQHLSVNGKSFAVFYLISHGVIKLFLIIGLIKKKLWAYHAFIMILGVFVLYQVYRYTITYSNLLLIFTLFDILLCWLAWKESMIIKRTVNKKNR
ncbi:MAG: DUF2127 domain-containing protein [Ginsengibacter sp.]